MLRLKIIFKDRANHRSRNNPIVEFLVHSMVVLTMESPSEECECGQSMIILDRTSGRGNIRYKSVFPVYTESHYHFDVCQ